MRVGYRIVGWSPAEGFRTLAGRQKIQPRIGRLDEMALPGIYLGTTRAFCEAYYTGLTDGDDVLLTYEYDERMLVSGDPAGDGEISVRQARLLAIENLSSDADQARLTVAL
jgi:hypothetical protein